MDLWRGVSRSSQKSTNSCALTSDRSRPGIQISEPMPPFGEWPARARPDLQGGSRSGLGVLSAAPKAKNHDPLPATAATDLSAV
jgi:hypothetical protein